MWCACFHTQIHAHTHAHTYTTVYIIIVGVYFSGDGASRYQDGHYQVTARVDDVINTKGHRLGTAELESIMLRDELP